MNKSIKFEIEQNKGFYFVVEMVDGYISTLVTGHKKIDEDEIESGIDSILFLHHSATNLSLSDSGELLDGILFRSTNIHYYIREKIDKKGKNSIRELKTIIIAGFSPNKREIRPGKVIDIIKKI